MRHSTTAAASAAGIQRKRAGSQRPCRSLSIRAETRDANPGAGSTWRKAARSSFSRSLLMCAATPSKWRRVAARGRGVCRAGDSLPKLLERALQMALYGVDRHLERPGDLGWIQVLLIAQQHHGASGRRQLGNQDAELPLQQRVARSRLAGEWQILRDRHQLVPGLPAQTVDGETARNLPQPEPQMRIRLHRCELAMQSDEYLLRKILRLVSV